MATTTKKKTATKKKKATTDLIVNVAHEVENMDKDTALTAAGNIDEDIEFSYFKLGGILARIHTEQWYAEEGFEQFHEFVEAKYGIRRSKAFHLISIYNGLIESGVAWNDVKDLGWSKLKELVNVITKKNVKGWVKRAKDMTVIQLVEYIKKQQAKAVKSTKGTEDGEAVSVDADEEETPSITHMTFKLHDDQKEIVNDALGKAKKEAGTDVSTVALEAICMGYLAGPSKPKDEKKKAGTVTQDDLREMMENFTWEDVLTVFEKVWPDVDITVETE